jgi:hypothetical protein
MRVPGLLLLAVQVVGCGGQALHEFPPGATPGERATLSDPGGTTTDQRRIIQTADISLVVEDFAAFEQRLAGLVPQSGGYVAESKVDRTQGYQRTGRWIVRVPINKFDAFVDEVTAAGVPESRQTHAQDVTAEFIDLQARLANKREIERRIVRLLDDRSGDIKDVIAVEAELGRVREEIERIEGRLKYLTHQTELTTVTITAREQKTYVPPQAPAFVAQIGQTWSASIHELTRFAQGSMLLAVGLTPWLLALAIIAFPIVRHFRRRARRSIFVT